MKMRIINEKYCIDYADFIQLLKEREWKLCVQLQDNWTAQRHIEYICNLISTKSDLTVLFFVDSHSMDLIRKIDVYITRMNQERELISTQKHIQFINF